MKLKKAVAFTLIVSLTIAVVIFGFAIIAKDTDNDQQVVTSTSVAEPENIQPNSSNVSSLDAASKEEVVSETCGVKGGECSAAEIAKRNSQNECWVIYRGSYYDVTAYINEHNGGAAVFNESTCGKDIQPFMEGDRSSAGRQNEHSNRAYSELEQLKIGTVKNN